MRLHSYLPHKIGLCTVTDKIYKPRKIATDNFAQHKHYPAVAKSDLSASLSSTEETYFAVIHWLPEVSRTARHLGSMQVSILPLIRARGEPSAGAQTRTYWPRASSACHRP